MKIIYHCYGGTHSSVTAAGIHLGLLPRDRVPGPRELLDQSLFDRQKVDDLGRICRVGRDKMGNEIYVVGRRSRPNLLYNVTSGLSGLIGMDRDGLLLVDVSSYVNSSMKAGGFMSRRLGLVRLGRPIVTWGTLRNYEKLVAVVEEVFTKIKHWPGAKGGGAIQIKNPEAVY